MGSGLLRGTWYGVWVSRRRANGGGDGDFSDKFEGECGEDEGAIWRLGFCASIWVSQRGFTLLADCHAA